MGNWVMTVKGIGPHGNNSDTDPERAMQHLCDYMKSNGHRVDSAEISYPSPAASCCGHSAEHTENGCTQQGCSCNG